MTTTTETATTGMTCPDWCSEPPGRHDVYLSGGRAVIDHCREFGPYLYGTATLHAETGEQVAGREVRFRDLGDVDVAAAGLRGLATDARAAAEWLEAGKAQA